MKPRPKRRRKRSGRLIREDIGMAEKLHVTCHQGNACHCIPVRAAQMQLDA
jgi:hypothetical protein